jgi:hypothetical protein
MYLQRFERLEVSECVRCHGTDLVVAQISKIFFNINIMHKIHKIISRFETALHMLWTTVSSKHFLNDNR